jgi:hypothetical protein
MIETNQKSFSIFNINSEFSFSSNNLSQSINNNHKKNLSFISNKTKINALKKNLFPFNSNSVKNYSFIIENTNPGPGEYYKANLYENYKKNVKKKDSFISKDKRFKYYSVDVPGPGTYFLHKNESFNKNLNKNNYLKYSLNNNYHLNSLNSSVSTIPSKEQKLGYYYNNNNELKIFEDPDKNLKYSGELNDTVGPAKYNPIIPKEKNSIVKWDKTFDSTINKKKNNHLTSFYTNDLNFSNLNNEKTNNKNTCLINNKQKFLYKNIHYIISKNKYDKQYLEPKLYKKILEEKNEEKEEYKNFINNREAKEKNFKLNFNNLRYQYNKNKINFQYFGSSSYRNTSLINEKENNIKVGPGSYFKEKNDIYYKYKKPKTNRNINNLHLFSNILIKYKSNPNFIIKNNNIVYFKKKSNKNDENDKNIRNTKKTIKKSFSKNNTFGLEKRFKEFFLKNINPGPGQYNPPDIWKKEEIIKNNIIHNENDKNLIKSNEKILKNILKKKEIKNDACNYQNDIFLNLIKNNLRNKKYLKKFPFSSHSERFKENKNINPNVGPGKYNINTVSENIYNSRFPFNSSNKRIIKEKDNFIPIQYSYDNYFDWNKKSYNIIYI